MPFGCLWELKEKGAYMWPWVSNRKGEMIPSLQGLRESDRWTDGGGIVWFKGVIDKRRHSWGISDKLLKHHTTEMVICKHPLKPESTKGKSWSNSSHFYPPPSHPQIISTKPQEEAEKQGTETLCIAESQFPKDLNEKSRRFKFK